MLALGLQSINTKEPRSVEETSKVVAEEAVRERFMFMFFFDDVILLLGDSDSKKEIFILSRRCSVVKWQRVSCFVAATTFVKTAIRQIRCCVGVFSCAVNKLLPGQKSKKKKDSWLEKHR